MIFPSAIVGEKLVRNDTNCVLYYQQKNKTNCPAVLPRTNCPMEKEHQLRSIWMAPAKTQLVRGCGLRIILFITEFITELA